MPLRRTLIALYVTCMALAPAVPASAENGVTVDPGSPSGKEYAIPLDSARRDAAAGGRATPEPGATTSSPLFGEGVGDPGSAAGSPPRGGRSKAQPASRARASATAKPSGAAIASVHRAAAGVPEGGSSSLLTIAAVALSVLLLGGVIGSIARRRST